MNSPWILIAAILALGAIYVLSPQVLHTFQRFRNKRVLTCPETNGPAEVDINASRAAFTSALGRPLLRVKNCSLWPKKKGCPEECLKE